MRANLALPRWAIVFAAACFLLWAFQVAAGREPGEFVIDQTCDSFDPLGSTSLWYCDVSQEFIPELRAVEIVELYTMDYDWGDDTGGTLIVNIRESTPDGAIVGTSLVTELPHNFEGVTRFEFDAPVPLTPGEVYLIHLVYVAGSNWAFGRYGHIEDICPEVQRFCGDSTVIDDLWFREGVTGPSPVEATTWGVVKTLYRQAP